MNWKSQFIAMFKTWCIGTYKTKNDTKKTTNEFRYFLESNFVRVNRLFVLVYANYSNNANRFNAWKYYSPKGIIKNHNVIINGKKLL